MWINIAPFADSKEKPWINDKEIVRNYLKQKKNYEKIIFFFSHIQAYYPKNSILL